MTTATQSKTSKTAAATAPANGEAAKDTKTRAPRPDVSGLDLTAIAGATPAAAAVVAAAAPRQERSEQQQAMDKVVVRAHDAWVKAGRPAAWNKMPVVTYYLDPTHVEGFRYLIRRACDFADLAAKFGHPMTVTRELAQSAGLPADHVGREVLAFAVKDKRPRSSK